VQAPYGDSEQIARVIETFRGKWTVQILCEMRRGPVRLGQLKQVNSYGFQEGTDFKSSLARRCKADRSIGFDQVNPSCRVRAG
jgi:hypothetical protein